MNDLTHDPLAHVTEQPDISALIDEFQDAQNEGPWSAGKIARAEDIRYNRWPGKSNPPDGCKWKGNNAGVNVQPYDGRPDLDVNLTDELCSAIVDIDVMAWSQANIGTTTTHTTQATAAQSAELSAIGRWIKKVTQPDARRGVELLSQMKTMLGWCVVNTGWMERWGLVERELDLQEMIQNSAQLPPGHPLRQFPMLILDPDFEQQAVEMAQMVFPVLKKSEARRVVRELRDEQQTKFLDKIPEQKRPCFKILIPGYNLFVSGGAEEIQDARGFLVVERFYQAQLEGIAADNNWNEDFTEAVIGTMGQFSTYGERLTLRAMNNRDDVRDRGIEIWTTYVRQMDEDTGATGIYCTTFSPHLRPTNQKSPETFYARHYLLEYAHGQYPFAQVELEVNGPALDDSRGVPEMLASDQEAIKKHQDALAIRAQWEIAPAQIFVGAGWSKTQEKVIPGSRVTAPPGASITSFGVDKGSAEIGERFIERIENGTRRRFALPNNTDGSHPSAWQMRQIRSTKRWLSCWEDVYSQMAVLTYQYLNPEELMQVIGRWPQLVAEDLLNHRITLTYEPRALDQDWVKTVLEFIQQLMMFDKGGLIDTGPLVRIGLSYIDPTIIQEVLRDEKGASQAMYKQVENDISSLILGNPPKMVEMDATAGMQLQMAMAVIGKNPRYQEILMKDPQIQENFQTYAKNLEHSNQQTSISPIQGRLGVQAMPQTPTRSGSMQPA